MKKQIDLNITGMSCNHCVMTIESALTGKPGVKDVKVDLNKKEARITITDAIEPDALISVIEELGYGATVK